MDSIEAECTVFGEKFLNAKECAKLISTIKSQINLQKPSTKTIKENVEMHSSKCNLSSLEDTFVEEIETRICKIMGISREYSEPMIGYNFSEEQVSFFSYKNILQSANVLNEENFTFLVYLNDEDWESKTILENFDLKCISN